jgi:hypothetical protein
MFKYNVVIIIDQYTVLLSTNILYHYQPIYCIIINQCNIHYCIIINQYTVSLSTNILYHYQPIYITVLLSTNILCYYQPIYCIIIDQYTVPLSTNILYYYQPIYCIITNQYTVLFTTDYQRSISEDFSTSPSRFHASPKCNKGRVHCDGGIHIFTGTNTGLVIFPITKILTC